ncbi:MAG: hypothetical protein OEM41_08640 [Ignavibacteria bacterium]|nr:hypothetical protein [Ignavibacteria bacterium]
MHRLLSGPIRTAPLTLGLVVLLMAPARAQYYEPTEYQQSTDRFGYLGAMERDFQPLSSNSMPDSSSIGFKRWMAMVGIRQGLFDITFAYNRYTLRGEKKTTVFFGATAMQDIPVIGKRPTALVIPVMVSADFTKAENTGPARKDFNIASLGIGAGLKFRTSGSAIDFSVYVTEVVHYSFEGLSSGSGFSAATLAEASLSLNRIPLVGGIVLGYRFRYQTWSMSDDQFDYKAIAHGPYLGVGF